MTATTPSTVLVAVQPAFTQSERLALAGFLVGYRGLTREAYTLDLRQFTAWCRFRSPPLSRSAALTSRHGCSIRQRPDLALPTPAQNSP